ncbi:N-acetylmuramoyl-L-alanine amidase [Proteiniclasticum sp. C24MP]|uniref:N-acetylmuramoyl-L-alanine amidase n=1 Tax=Proteiniclasticum sp. C24MP TaxID=3374101 RepID=UPI0037552DF5
MNKAISFLLCFILSFSLGVTTEKSSATTQPEDLSVQEGQESRYAVRTDGDEYSLYVPSDEFERLEDVISSDANGEYRFNFIDFNDLGQKHEIVDHVFRVLNEEFRESENIYVYESVFQFLSNEHEITGEETIMISSEERLFPYLEVAEDGIVPEEEEKSERDTVHTGEVVDDETPVVEERPVLEEAVVTYRTHVQSIGWQNYVENGIVSGTVGERKRVEAIEVNIESELDLGVRYTTLVNGLGWQEYGSDGSVNGTTGQGRAIEAVSLELTGEGKEAFDLYYRVHSSKVGWLGWAKNGEKAGTEGFGYQMEAMEIRLIEKGEPAPGQDDDSYMVYGEIVQIGYEYLNDMNEWKEGSDEEDLSSPFMNLRIGLTTNQKLDIRYSAYYENSGWQSYAGNGEAAGGSDAYDKLKALKVYLSGEDKDRYDILYRVRMSQRGWMDWTKNGFAAGSESVGDYVVDLEIRVTERDTEGIQGGISYIGSGKEHLVSYETHIQRRGWLDPAYDGETGGTLDNLRMESMRISLGQQLPEGSIHYSAHVQSYGWMEEVSDGLLSGTVGEGKRMEAISIALSGTVSELYDVYYRVKVQNLEWLGWAKNGEAAGTESFGLFIEAIEVKLVGKEERKPESMRMPYRRNEGNPILLYKSSSSGYSEEQYLLQEETSGTVGERLGLTDLDAAVLGSSGLTIEFEGYKTGDGWVRGKSGDGLTLKNANLLESVKFELHGEQKDKYDIYYRIHVQKLGWMGWAKNGFAAGTLHLGLRIEAMELKLLPKDSEADIISEGYFKTTTEPAPFSYRAHIQKVGWVDSENTGEIIGTMGRSLRLEALGLTLGEHMPSGSIELGAFVKGLGWMESEEDTLVGTSGEGRRLEEVSMHLSGYIAEVFDIYYRAHVQRLGWLSWAKNGEKAGTAFYNYQIEAVEVKLVPKGEVFSGDVTESYVMKIPAYIKTRYMTRNDCYTRDRQIIPQGLMVHSTASPGVMAGQWFDRWNKSYDAGEINRQAAVHAFVDDKEVWQYLPWNHRGWHAGGKANDTHIGIEMVEPAGHGYSGSRMIGYDPVKNAEFFRNVWDKTVNLSVILARMYSFDHNDIISHNEGGKLGVASYSADVAHWFPYHNKSMDDFRLAVKKGLGLE